MATPIIQFYAAQGKDGKWGVCPFSQRVKMTLINKGLPFEEILVDLSNKPDDFLSLNPAGTVPVITYDHMVICDSDKICNFLEKEHPDPPMLPENKGQEQEQEREKKVLEEFGMVFFGAFKALVLNGDPKRDAELLSKVKEELWKLEEILEQREKEARQPKPEKLEEGKQGKGLEEEKQKEAEKEREGRKRKQVGQREGKEQMEIKEMEGPFLSGNLFSMADAKIAPQLFTAVPALKGVKNIDLFKDEKLRGVKDYLRRIREFHLFKETAAEEDMIAEEWKGKAQLREE